MIPFAATLTFAVPLALAAPPAPAQSQADAPLAALVRNFVDAELRFDAKRLATLITPDYAEVSPLGDLDLHDAFLGFYAVDRKQPTPEMKIGEMLVRRYGDAASIITSLSFERPGPDGQPRTMAIRVGFLAVRSGGEWKLASAQYTPERPKAPPAPPAK